MVWLAGAAAPAAVLWTGQALSALAALAAYLLARRLTTWPVAAVAAAAVPAALYWFPAYYASWGRYTQLAGMVALPAAWVLLYDAIRPDSAVLPRRGLVLAAVAAAGLVLVHYRVAAVFAPGVVLLAVVALIRGGDRRAVIRRLTAVVAMSLLLAAPWLARNLLGGIQTLRAASDTWYASPAEVDSVPEWLFTVGANTLWLRLGALGLLVGLWRRRPGAWLAAACVAAMTLLASPTLTGLPPSWMLPRFAVAIGAWLPVAVGVAFLVDGLVDLVLWLGARRSWVGQPGRVLTLAAAGVVAVTILGAWSMRQVVNRSLILAQAADVRAMAWVRQHTAADARFMVRSAEWQLGTYRGLDGGYWLPLLAARATTMPAVFYNYGERDYGLQVAATARDVAAAGNLSDRDLLALMQTTGSDYVYLGPVTTDHEGTLTPDRLGRVPGLERVYDVDGVTIFRRRIAGRPAEPKP